MDKQSKIIALLNRTNQKGISIFLEGEKLKIKIEKNKKPDVELIKELKIYKKEVITFLKSEKADFKKVKKVQQQIQPINKSQWQEIPLSFAQERLWFLDALQGSLNYHLPLVLALNGQIDSTVLALAFKKIIERHEVLRSIYETKEGQTYQKINTADKWELSTEILENSTKITLEQVVKNMVKMPFDLSKDYMLRAKLIQQEPSKQVLIVLLHHIAADGWSMSIIIQELVAFYQALIKKTPAPLVKLPIQYADYAVWQRTKLNQATASKQLDYWAKQLNGVAPLNLPTDYLRPSIQSIRGQSTTFKIDKVLSEQVLNLSKTAETTLFMTLLAVFKVLLFRYSGQSDICVGSPIANRTQKELAPLIGFFVNTVALRSTLVAATSFLELLGAIKKTTLAAFSNQDVSFEQIVERSSQVRERSRSPLFQVMFSVQNKLNNTKIELPELTIASVGFEQKTSKFDLSFVIEESTDDLTVTIEYCTALFKPDRIERMKAHFKQLLTAIVDNPHQSIGQLNILDVREKKQLLDGFNQTERDYPSDKTLIELFQQQVLLHPNKTAIKDGNRQLTYQELELKANQFGHYLLSKGVQKNTLVCVCLDRSLELLISFIGILKTGATYVPIDPNYPVDRLNFLIADTKATLIICEENFPISSKQKGDFTKIVFSKDSPIIEQSSTKYIKTNTTKTDVAYVIYTSGSTGTPKGVMVTNKGVTNLVYWHIEAFGISSKSKATLIAGVGFDASVSEIWPYLCAGGTVNIVNQATRLSPEKLLKFYQQEGITHSFQPTLFIKDFIEVSKNVQLSLDYLFAGGDSLPILDVTTLDYKLVNDYGPAENTVVSTYYELKEIDKSQIPSIGKPIANVQVLVLDEQGNLVPIGVVGEVCLAGEGLAKGYWQRPDLTKHKFVPHPFKTRVGEKMYKTGDWAYWTPDGNLTFIGRKDNQVQIRGHRIELGEIEMAIQQSKMVAKCAVIAKSNQTGTRSLIAYILPASNYSKEAVLTYLSSQLPAYMIPSFLIEITQLPLNANGKIDKKALPVVDITALAQRAYQAPQNEKEAILVNIFEILLGINKVGIHDNFFELGGHSLLATRLVSLVRKRLDTELSINDVFDKSTVFQLARLLTDKAQEKVLPTITKQVRPTKIPLSFAQERLWFIDSLQGSLNYHIPFYLKIEGIIPPEKLEFAFKTILRRHEVLRTTYQETAGQIYQKIIPEAAWKLGYQAKGEPTAALKHLAELNERAFDLSKDYMLRAKLVKTSATTQILVLVIHHIAADGWSMSIFVKELMAVYQAIVTNQSPILPDVEIQYADYAIWQQKHLGATELSEKLAYWQKQLQGIKPLALPTDFSRPTIQSIKGQTINFNINKQLTNQLNALAKAEEATLFMTLLAIFKVLLYRYSGQTDIVVGIGVANRRQVEIESLIGFFVNSLAIRSNLGELPSFKTFLAQVKATTLTAYTHQEVPFEKVVDSIGSNRDRSRSPLFQVAFILQNTPDIPVLQLGDVRLSPGPIEQNTAKYDLTFFVKATKEGLTMELEYCSDLFHLSTMEKMADHYQALMASVVEDSLQTVDALKMLTTNEEAQLVNEFNQTKKDFPQQLTAIDLWTKSVQNAANQSALIFNQAHISYQGLEIKSNQLGHYLRKKGVRAEQIIAVCMDRSIEMIISILGILKAGGAYVPIDPTYPKERIDYILKDTDTPLILTQGNFEPLLDTKKGRTIISIDTAWPNIQQESKDSVINAVKPDGLMYVIYTSGSTGQPKGVMVEHRNNINMVLDQIRIFDITKDDKILQFASLSFDASVFEIFMALYSGATLVLIDKPTISNQERFMTYIKSKQVSMITFPPTYLKSLSLDQLKFLRVIITAGEAADTQQLVAASTFCNAFNAYGPTECAVCVSTYQVSEKDASKKQLPIGKPIANTKIYILDKNRQLVPVNIAGEIWVSGVGVARGYLNRPALTKEKFTSHIFENGESVRLYRTGDIGRWLPDGNIAFVGRADSQVKVRGFRIELGEIENNLNRLEEVDGNAVVVKTEVDASSSLVNYYVPNQTYLAQQEKELYLSQIENWQQISKAEHEKRNAIATDAQFNIDGWIDTFTGKAIPAEQMREWLADITQLILSEQPQRVVEIGSGTGLIYHQLAKHIDRYIGVDISKVDIENLKQEVQKQANYPQTDLFLAAAHQLEIAASEKVDTVILNSVIQYFPGADYLEEVIANSINYLNGKGRIIIGDVRHYGLQKDFKGRLHFERALEENKSLADFEFYIEQEIFKDKELCVSPAYFYQLKQKYPLITHVEIAYKQTQYSNEMSLYRYNVVVYIGGEKELFAPKWENWEIVKDKENYLEKLSASTDLIAIQNVPNPKLGRETHLAEHLKNKRFKYLGDVARTIESTKVAATAVKELLTESQKLGYTYRLLVNQNPLKVNLILSKKRLKKFVVNAYPFEKNKHTKSLVSVPLFYEAASELEKTIKQRLGERLPDYMIPSHFIPLPVLPLTVNGKVNRNLLKGYQTIKMRGEVGYEAPTSKVELLLAKIWSELLNIEKVSISDDFFELGGHSLLATRVIAAIRNELAVEIGVKEIFTKSTIADLAKFIENEGQATQKIQITAQKRPGKIPLSFAQEMLWSIDQLQGSEHYKLPLILHFTGTIEADLIEVAFQKIINRHEILRTVYKETAGESYQEILAKDKWYLDWHKEEKINEENLQKLLANYISRVFDLSKNYPIRATILPIADNESLLVIVIHHIAYDGWSMPIIVRELVTFYQATKKNIEPNLPKLAIQYADYSIWQRNYLKGKTLDKLLAYWEEKLKNINPLILPTDFPRPAVKSTKGDSLELQLDLGLSNQLKALSKREGSTLYMTLLTVYKILLYRYTDHSDVTVGSTLANRTQTAIEPLIGFFLNTLPIRSNLSNNPTFLQLLVQVKNNTLEAYDNQTIPFEKIIEKVQKESDSSPIPIFQTIFMLLNTPETPSLNLPGLKMKMRNIKLKTSRIDLSFTITDRKEGIFFKINYSPDLFLPATIEKLKSHFAELLLSVIKNPQQNIDDLRLIPPVELKYNTIEDRKCDFLPDTRR